MIISLEIISYRVIWRGSTRNTVSLRNSRLINLRNMDEFNSLTFVEFNMQADWVKSKQTPCWSVPEPDTEPCCTWLDSLLIGIEQTTSWVIFGRIKQPTCGCRQVNSLHVMLMSELNPFLWLSAALSTFQHVISSFSFPYRISFLTQHAFNP